MALQPRANVGSWPKKKLPCPSHFSLASVNRDSHKGPIKNPYINRVSDPTPFGSDPSSTSQAPSMVQVFVGLGLGSSRQGPWFYSPIFRSGAMYHLWRLVSENVFGDKSVTLWFFPRKDAQRFGFSDEKTEKRHQIYNLEPFQGYKVTFQKDPQDLRATYLINTIRHQLKNVQKASSWEVIFPYIFQQKHRQSLLPQEMILVPSAKSIWGRANGLLENRQQLYLWHGKPYQLSKSDFTLLGNFSKGIVLSIWQVL